jgi:hypothetical protein
MGWKQSLPIAGALGALAIGGVAMTAGTGAVEAAVPSQVTAIVDGVTEGPGHWLGRFGHRGLRGTAVAEELGIDVETFRDAVRTVIEARRDADEERPSDLTPEERLAYRAEFIEDLAAELGIGASELEAAFDTVFEAKLDEAVADGRITQEEADELLEAYQNGTLHELRAERRIEALGDRLTQMLENGIIDDAEYAALQAELDEEDLEGFHELLREYREAGELDGSFRGPRGHRGFDGFRDGTDGSDDSSESGTSSGGISL